MAAQPPPSLPVSSQQSPLLPQQQTSQQQQAQAEQQQHAAKKIKTEHQPYAFSPPASAASSPPAIPGLPVNGHAVNQPGSSVGAGAGASAGAGGYSASTPRSPFVPTAVSTPQRSALGSIPSGQPMGPPQLPTGRPPGGGQAGGLSTPTGGQAPWGGASGWAGSLPSTPNVAQSGRPGAAGANLPNQGPRTPLLAGGSTGGQGTSVRPGLSFGANATPGPSVAADAAPNTAGQQERAGGQDGRNDYDQLVDVMGSAGVDLRAEEEAIQQRDLLNSSASTAEHVEGRTHRDGLYLEVYPLSIKVHTIAAAHQLGVEPDVLNYLALAARTRFRNLVEAMILASRHRVWSSHLHAPPLYDDPDHTPMYHELLHSDPAKQLAALERVDREEENRRRRARAEREEAEAAAEAGGGDVDADMANGTGEGASGPSTPRPGTGDSKKKKKMGPGVTARNMSEDVRKRLADSTAMRNLGLSGSKYSWLSGSGAWGGGGGPANSPLANKGKFKADQSASGDEERPAGLPRPKFAPPVGGPTGAKTNLGSSESTPAGQRPGESQDSGGADAGARTGAGPWGRSLAPSGLGAGGPGPPGALGGGSGVPPTPGAWGDVAARQAAKEEEERQRRMRVTMRDALFALEKERAGGAGRGSGERALYRARARANDESQ